jgi:predicted membrane channel-forming protein YqfA (hemolysin III family)
LTKRLKLYTFDIYYEYEWLWCENWNQGRYWDHAIETVNCVCSGKCCRQLIPKCDRPGEVRVFVAVFWCVLWDIAYYIRYLFVRFLEDIVLGECLWLTGIYIYIQRLKNQSTINLTGVGSLRYNDTIQVKQL